MFVLVLIFSLFYCPIKTYAQNTPCSGKKGGIAYCEMGRFICQDGSVSQSKKLCEGYNKNTPPLTSYKIESSENVIYRWEDKNGVTHFSDRPKNK